MEINFEKLKNSGIRASLLALVKETCPDATDVVDVVIHLRHRWMLNVWPVGRMYIAEERVIKIQ